MSSRQDIDLRQNQSSGRSDSADPNPAATSPVVSPAHSPVQLTTYVHSTCHHCHHWIDAKEWTFFPDAERHSSLKCDSCGEKVLGLGRRSTHGSLLSQITRTSTSRRQSSIHVCTNSLQDARRPRSPTRQSTSGDISSAILHGIGQSSLTAQSPAAGDKIEGRPTQQPLNEDESTAVVPRSAPAPSDARGRSSGVRPSPRRTPPEKKRVKWLRACVKKIANLLDPEVVVDIKRPHLASTIANADVVDDRNPESDGRFQQSITQTLRRRTDNGDGVEPPFPPDHISGNRDLSTSATARDSSADKDSARIRNEDDVDKRKRDPGRLERINTERLSKTPTTQQVLCQCRAGHCPCTQVDSLSRQNSLATTSSFPPTPGLTTEPSTRSNTQHSFSAQSGSTRSGSLRSLPAAARDTFFRHHGAQFMRFRGGRDSIVSDTSGQSNASRFSTSSHPSRINSIATEASSSGSRPTSSSARLHGPTGLSQVILQDDLPQVSEPTTLQQLPTIFPHSPILEEPQNDNQLRGPSLHVDTTVGDMNLRPPTEGEHNETDSRGNSSRTITQEGQNQLDFIRGPREDV